MTSATYNKILAWMVHLFTASGGILALLALQAINEHDFLQAIWYMSGAVLIDAIDGTLARKAQVSRYAAKIDGALLDNIIDFIHYVILPAFFLLSYDGLLLEPFKSFLPYIIVICSAYQFTQKDAKTKDNFFKGFPSYWNFVVFYMFIFESSPNINSLVIIVLLVLIFIPIKYVYPSRMNFLTRIKALRTIMLGLSLLFGLFNFLILIFYPDVNILLKIYVLFYVLIYFLVSIYCSWK